MSEQVPPSAATTTAERQAVDAVIARHEGELYNLRFSLMGAHQNLASTRDSIERGAMFALGNDAAIERAKERIARLERAIDVEADALRPWAAIYTGWNRAFLAVTNSGGHVHNTTSCPTCHKGEFMTRLSWMTDYSDLTEADIVEAAGERACTVCYPTAPVDALNRPTKMFSEDEISAKAAREAREQAKIARDAAKAAKNLVTPVREEEGRSSMFETIASAWLELIGNQANTRLYGYRAKDDLNTRLRASLHETLVGRDGMSDADFKALEAKKLAAKLKRG